MTKITTYIELQDAIHQLERKNSLQEQELRENYEQVLQSLTPKNILKSAFKHIASSDELKNSAINTAIGLGTGYVTRKLYVGRSANMLKKLAGTVLQFAVTNFVRKKAPVIREKISELRENNKD